VNAIENGQEETDNTSHATWNKWNLSLNVGAVFNAWQLLQKLESYQQVFTISSPTAWGKLKVCAKHIPCVLSDDQRAICVLATAHLQHWRNEGSAFLDRVLLVDESWIHSFYPWLKQQNTKWHVQMSPRKKIAWHSQDALKVMHIMFFSLNGLVLDHPVPVGRMAHGQISAHSCRIRWGWLFVINNQNCLNMVSFCSKTMQQSLLLWFANSGATMGLRGVGTSSLLSRSHPIWLLVVCTCERTSLG